MTHRDRPRVCVATPYAGQLLTGESGYFGGAEVRGAVFLDGLVRSNRWDVHAVIMGSPEAPRRLPSGLTLHTRPPDPWLAEAPRPMILESVWSAVDAEVYLAFGANQASAEVARYCEVVGKPFVLSIASDAAFHPDVYEGSAQVDVYGDKGHFAWYAITRARKVVVQSDQQRALYASRYDREATIVRNPAPSGPWGSPRTRVEHGGRLLWIGRIDPNKRYDELISVAALLPHREFMIVCNDVSNLSATAIPDLQDAMPSVMIADQVPLAATWDLFRFCDLLVNTSIVEGFPNTFVQAGMQGVPIVSMAVDPDGMFSRHGCGRLADNTATGTAAAIDAMLSDENGYADASAAISAWVRTRHDPEERIREMETVLLEALA
jgi:glycosyltransferase involved in cell wall biosynthesis